jgi:hypothetical protein
MPLSCVESTYFRQLLQCIQPSIERYLPESHNTMRGWIIKDFEAAQLSVTQQLAIAKSRIHLSFDLWTSPSVFALVGVVAHYLSPELQMRHTLLGIRQIEGSHTGENIAEVVARVITTYEVERRLGIFVTDNAKSNDTAVSHLLQSLDISEPPGSRRGRCLGHIINLAAKSFLLGQDCEAFAIDEKAAELAANIDETRLGHLQRLWRSKGPIGKFHNVVAFIRASPQRREVFSDCISWLESDEQGWI